MTSSKNTTPEVSIGMPVYNGESYIREALDSLLAQTFTDFELIISDNASTDGTESICREYVKRDGRIRYVRQDMNRGMLENFKFVLDSAIGNYFMWAAADDWWSPEFIYECLFFLSHNSNYIGAITKCKNGDDTDITSTGCRPICEDTFKGRVHEFMKSPGANSRFYSLFRISVIRVVDISRYDYLGGDWAIVVELLAYGRIGLSSERIGFIKSGGMSSEYSKLMDSFRKHSIEYILPFYHLSKYIVGLNMVTPGMVKRLALLNFGYASSYWKIRLKRKAVEFYENTIGNKHSFAR